MKIENRIKHNMEMLVKYYQSFLDSIEEYQDIYQDNEEKLDYLQEVLATENPFNKCLHDLLYDLYDYEENIKDKL